LAYTPILNLPQVAPNQSQKEATINTAIGILEAAQNDALSHATSGVTTLVLNQDQFTKYFVHDFSGHTAALLVKIPQSRRAFMVQNNGTANLTLQIDKPAATGGLVVPPGKVVTAQSDGSTIRATSSGVSKLQDLSDINFNALTNGAVLKYDSTLERWVPGQFSASTFVALSDTPTTFAGEGGKFLRVNPGSTAVEFVAPTTKSLTDFPAYNATKANHVLAVSEDGQTLVYVSPSEAGLVTMDQIADVEATAPADGAILTYDADDSVWKAGPAPSSAFKLDDLTDVATASATALQLLRRNADNTRWEPWTLPTLVTTLDSLTDVSASSPVQGDALLFDEATQTWQPGPPGGLLSLNDLTDVTSVLPTSGDFLAYDDATEQWRPITPTLDTLADVISDGGALDGDVLTYDADTQTWSPKRMLSSGVLEHNTGGSYTLSSDDNGMIVLTNETGITVLIPGHANDPIPVGTSISFMRRGGDVSFDVIIDQNSALLYPNDVQPFLRTQNSVCSVMKINESEWVLFGDLRSDDL
jgi:hypothetical protein